MSISKLIREIQSRVIKTNFPNSKINYCLAYHMPFFRNGRSWEKQVSENYRAFEGRDGQWFAYPIHKNKSEAMYKINLYELSLSDFDKYDSLEDLKKNYSE